MILNIKLYGRRYKKLREYNPSLWVPSMGDGFFILIGGYKDPQKAVPQNISEYDVTWVSTNISMFEGV